MFARSVLPRGPARDSLAAAVRQRVCVAVRRQAAQALRRRLPSRTPAPPAAGPGTEITAASAATLEAESAAHTWPVPLPAVAPIATPRATQPLARSGIPVTHAAPVEAAAGSPVAAAMATLATPEPAVAVAVLAAPLASGCYPPVPQPQPLAAGRGVGLPLSSLSLAVSPLLPFVEPLRGLPGAPLGPWATPVPLVPSAAAAPPVDLVRVPDHCSMHFWPPPPAGQRSSTACVGLGGNGTQDPSCHAALPPAPSPPPVPPPPPSPGDVAPDPSWPLPGQADPRRPVAWLQPSPRAPSLPPSLPWGEHYSAGPPSLAESHPAGPAASLLPLPQMPMPLAPAAPGESHSPPSLAPTDLSV